MAYLALFSRLRLKQRIASFLHCRNTSRIIGIFWTLSPIRYTFQQSRCASLPIIKWVCVTHTVFESCESIPVHLLYISTITLPVYVITYFQVRMSFGSRELRVFNSLYIRFTFQQLWWSSFPDIVWEQLVRVVSHPLSICYTYTTTQFNYYGARQPIINVDWKKDRKSEYKWISLQRKQ